MLHAFAVKLPTPAWMCTYPTWSEWEAHTDSYKRGNW